VRLAARRGTSRAMASSADQAEIAFSSIGGPAQIIPALIVGTLR
jgi:hypothetical protein